MPNVFIEESPILDDDIEYNIKVKCENEKSITIAKCWDYNLAETLLKSVKEYMNKK